MSYSFLNLTLLLITVPLLYHLYYVHLLNIWLNLTLIWFLKTNKFISVNLFGFRESLGTIEDFTYFIVNIYQDFCDKKYLSAILIDIKKAFGSVHVPTLISQLVSLSIPHYFCHYIASLFSHRFLTFTSPFEDFVLRYTYRELPHDSCLSPLLFNICMNSISQWLSSRGIQPYIYADDYYYRSCTFSPLTKSRSKMCRSQSPQQVSFAGKFFLKYMSSPNYFTLY